MTSDSDLGGCSKMVDFLIDCVEGKLSPGTQNDLDRHLDGCDSCAQHLQTYRTTVSLLRGLCDEDLPAELRNSVAAFLRSDTQPIH